MVQHLSKQDIRDYVDRSMQPERLLVLDEHIANCDECSESLTAMSTVVSPAVLNTIFEIDAADTEHLTYDMLVSYVDGQVDEIDREIVEAHRAACRACSDELDGLLSIKDQGSQGYVHPAAAVVSGSPARWRGLFAGGQWLRAAIPALAVLVIGFVVWVVWLKPANDQSASVTSPKVSETPVNEVAANGPDVNEPGNALTGVPLPDTGDPLPPVISLADGSSTIEIDADGNLTGVQDTEMVASVKAALKSQSIDVSSVAKQLRPKGQQLMGDSSPGVPFALAGPVGKVIETNRPQFRWRPLKDAESYIVSVFDGAFNKVAESPPLRQTDWMPATKLKRGAIYQWQVTAVKDGEEIKSPVMPAPEAKFKVIDAGSANDIAAAKRNGGSHLVLGILYAKAGLLDDAEREFQTLSKQNPNSPVVKKLLQKVRSAR